jgi:hypothetical protein
MNKLVVALAFALAGCLGTAPVDNHGPTGQGPVEQAPPPTAPPADLGGTDDAGKCGAMEFALTRIAPNVMLVLDRSGSMSDPIAAGSATTKYADLKSAVASLVTGYDSQMRLGATFFAADNNCMGGAVNPVAANNGQNVNTMVNNHSPGGNTPTAVTLDNVIASNQLADTTRANYAVLATDGLPNCGDVDVQKRIDTLYKATPSVKTYVIGVGDGTNSNPTLLNSWADAGHTARAGATHYFQTNSQADLKAAFDAIVGGIVSCDFKMTQSAPDPTLITVTENGTAISPSPTVGWTFDAATNTVTLHGAACDALKQNASTKIGVQYGCPGPPPIP